MISHTEKNPQESHNFIYRLSNTIEPAHTVSTDGVEEQDRLWKKVFINGAGNML